MREVISMHSETIEQRRRSSVRHALRTLTFLLGKLRADEGGNQHAIKRKLTFLLGKLRARGGGGRPSHHALTPRSISGSIAGSSAGSYLWGRGRGAVVSTCMLMLREQSAPSRAPARTCGEGEGGAVVSTCMLMLREQSAPARAPARTTAKAGTAAAQRSRACC